MKKFSEFCGEIDPILKINRKIQQVFTFSNGVKRLEEQVCALLEKENLNCRKVAPNIFSIANKKSLIFIPDSENSDGLFNFIKTYYNISNFLFCITNSQSLMKLKQLTDITKLKKFRAVSLCDIRYLPDYLKKLPLLTVT